MNNIYDELDRIEDIFDEFEESLLRNEIALMELIALQELSEQEIDDDEYIIHSYRGLVYEK